MKTSEEMNDFFKDFEKKLRDSQEDLPEEFAKILHDNLWDLLA